MSGTKDASNGIETALKRAMREQRITIDQLAFRTGISPRMIGRYREGVTLPRDSFGDPTDNALTLARALGVAVDDLFPPRTEETAA